MIKTIYINDLIHRYPSHTFTETTIDDEVLVEIKNSGGTLIAQARAQSMNVVVTAYQKIRNQLLKGEMPSFISTTTQRDVLTGIDRGTIIDNITVGRLEKYDGINWINVSRRSNALNITASTTQTQGNGLLSADLNVISTVANKKDVVTLPTATEGITVIVVNRGTKKLQVFPNTSDDLGEGVNNSVNIAAGSTIVFHCYDTTNWVSI